MTVREAITFFREVPKITNRLRVLDDVGLGYLRLASQPQLFPAAKRNASNSLRTCSSEPGRKHSTSSTNRPPAYTSTTSTSSSQRFAR